LSVDDLAAAISKTGVTPRPGDALIVRTGWLARWRAGTATEKQWAGLHPNCAEWIDEQGFALVGADNLAVEQGPSTTPEDAAPMHVALMRDRGVHLLELMDLEQLAIMGRTDFLLVVAPLRLVGGIASPVNPIAVL
jgi:kynurenine formamidase